MVGMFPVLVAMGGVVVARLLFLVVGLGLVVMISFGGVGGGRGWGWCDCGVDNEVGGVGWWGFGLFGCWVVVWVGLVGGLVVCGGVGWVG